ncbi:1-phosphofructokinase, partial [Enterococcus faecalis]
NKGPKLSEEHVQCFLKKISELRKGDYLCVSGSLPQGVSPSILIEISRICFENQVFLILDSSYEEILDCLPYQSFLL